MAVKVIKFDRCDVTLESPESLSIISTAMHCIEQNFHYMEFACQKYNSEDILTGEYVYKLGQNVLNKIIVDLDSANDEFIIELLEPVAPIREMNGETIHKSMVQVEVVTEGIAEDNDADFIGHKKVQDLRACGQYELGGVNSYYKKLGILDGIVFYYREL